MKLIMKQFHSSPQLLVLVATLVAACSSDDMPKTNALGTVPDGGDITVGLPDVPASEMLVPGLLEGSSDVEFAAQLFIAETQGISGPEVTASARFYRLTTPLADQPSLRPMNALDMCEISTEKSQITADALDFPIDHMLDATSDELVQVAGVSAGQSIELSADMGSYLSLSVNTDSDIQFNYQPQPGAALTSNVPDVLNVVVAGDRFPAYQWRWDKPQLLDSGLRDSVRSISADAQLTWRAASSSDFEQSRIYLYAGYINELTGAYQSYQCELEDDGAFTMPENIQTLHQNGFVANFVDVARYTRSVETLENSGISVVSVFMQKL